VCSFAFVVFDGEMLLRITVCYQLRDEGIGDKVCFNAALVCWLTS